MDESMALCSKREMRKRKMNRKESGCRNGVHMLSQEEFQILYKFHMESETIHFTQRLMAEELGVSLGKTNQIMNNLFEKELIENQDGNYRITACGLEALKPYKVQNAIIMAAGMSSRFAPLSYEKPKGLLKVKGDVLIEREIKQLQESGIMDITIVVGYMQEKFYYLEEKYGVKIVVNEDYYRYNNTSTLIRVLDRLSNTYICSSDNYFVDNVFEPYVYQAYYAAVYAPGDTDEYCLECDGKGKIKRVTVGGRASWYMMGHVYFDREFSDTFKLLLEREYKNTETREHYWEDLYIRHMKELNLHIRKYSADKVLEFDSLDELREFDSEYINNADSKILLNIGQALHCKTKDIVNIKAIKSGVTNTSFQFYIGNQPYIYRHPGKGTEKYINRKSEAAALRIAADLHLDDSFIYMDETEGWKISYYMEETRTMDVKNPQEITKALELMRNLHTKCVHFEYDFDIWKKIEEYHNQLKPLEEDEWDDFGKLYQLIVSVRKNIPLKQTASCLCHCNCVPANFLIDKQGNMYLMDWEYAGNDDPASDLGTFLGSTDITCEEAVTILEEYLEHVPEREEIQHYLGYTAISSYYWYLWALYQERNGKHLGTRIYTWYKNAKQYAHKTLDLFEEGRR